jgi:glycerol kinase
VDPDLLWSTTERTINEAMRHSGLRAGMQVRAIGITNQRETTIVWDRETGRPLHPAIIWSDLRTASLVERLSRELPPRSLELLRARTGLPLSTYFSALKLRWLQDEVPAVREALSAGRALVGTVDSWLLWKLSGGREHATDVTNASRTGLMDMRTLAWDPDLLTLFGLSPDLLRALPHIRSSSEELVRVAAGPLRGVPVAGCLGDQQAALLGHGCLREGDAKATYGTGAFVLVNAGNSRPPPVSRHGLLTTVAWQLGPRAPPCYALEGSVAVAGSALKWLRDQLRLVESSQEVDRLAAQVPDTGGVLFVPAFAGLFAPHWRPDARGLLIGLNHATSRAHIARAALEAAAYQTAEVLEAARRDAEHLRLQRLLVDGGMARSDLMLQLQADLAGLLVLRPSNLEATARGAAFAAGLALGLYSPDILTRDPPDAVRFEPQITQQDRERRMHRWHDAVKRSLAWEIGTSPASKL